MALNENIQLRESTYGVAVGACARAAKWQMAIQLLRQCRILEGTTSDMLSSNYVFVGGYNILSEGLLKIYGSIATIDPGSWIGKGSPSQPSGW